MLRSLKEQDESKERASIERESKTSHTHVKTRESYYLMQPQGVRRGPARRGKARRGQARKGKARKGRAR